MISIKFYFDIIRSYMTDFFDMVKSNHVINIIKLSKKNLKKLLHLYNLSLKYIYFFHENYERKTII